jgi:hypothetical protein
LRSRIVQAPAEPQAVPRPDVGHEAERHCIEAFCFVCKETEAVISGWQDTEWAEGPMEPAPMTDD